MTMTLTTTLASAVPPSLLVLSLVVAAVGVVVLRKRLHARRQLGISWRAVAGQLGLAPVRRGGRVALEGEGWRGLDRVSVTLNSDLRSDGETVRLELERAGAFAMCPTLDSLEPSPEGTRRRPRAEAGRVLTGDPQLDQGARALRAAGRADRVFAHLTADVRRDLALLADLGKVQLRPGILRLHVPVGRTVAGQLGLLLDLAHRVFEELDVRDASVAEAQLEQTILNDRKASVRARAVRAVVSAPSTPQRRTVLLGALRDESVAVAVEAAVGLGAVGAERLGELLAARQLDVTSLNRVAARLSAGADAATVELLEALGDRTWLLATAPRLATAWLDGVGAAGKPSLIPAVAALIDQPRLRQEVAARAVAVLGAFGRPAADALARVVAEPPAALGAGAAHVMAVQALARVGGKPDVALLSGVARQVAAPTPVRRAAKEAVRTLARRLELGTQTMQRLSVVAPPPRRGQRVAMATS